MTLLTPGPLRWKSWIVERSLTSNRYVPACSDVTFLPPLCSEMEKPGPTEPFTTFGAAPADAVSTRAAAATIERSAIEMRAIDTWLGSLLACMSYLLGRFDNAS